MKIHEYNEMMAHLTRRRPMSMGGRINFSRVNFSRGGAAKVYDYLESLPEGTEIDLNFVRDYVEKNNIDADADNVFKNFYEIDRKQKAASGNITFKHGEERRKQLQRIKNKLVFKKLKEFIPATKENLEKLDNLIKNTNLNIEQIGEELGFKNPKSLKFAPTSKNVLVKEYIKKYGNPPEGRFKRILTPDSEIVKKAIGLKEQGLSTRQIARELGVTQNSVVNYYRAGNREDLVGEVPAKKEGTPESRKKAARMANIKEGEKFASKADKAFNKAEDLRVQRINTFLKNNSDQLANNQNFINLVNLKLDGKGNIISKNKSPEEIAKLLKKDRLFERDHISSVAKRKRNMQFPVNFQMAPQNINQGFFGAAEAYVNRPDADPEKIKKISNVLDQYGLRLSTNKGTIGAKQIPASQVIDRNLSSLGLSTDIGKTVQPTKAISGAKNVTQLNAKLPIISTMYDVAKSIPGDIGKAKYLSAGFKTLGLAVAPYVAYTTFQDLKAGKNLVEALERNLIGTDIIGGTKDILAMTPEEREARAKVKQEQIAELNIDMPTGFGFIEAPPVQTDMALEEAKQKLDAAKQRVAQERAEDEAGVAALRRQAFDKVIDAATGNRTTAMKLAGGGLLKQAGKRSGPPPEKGPGGLASLEDYARTMME